MTTYAFVSLPTNINQIRHFWPIARILPDLIIKKYFKYIFAPKVFPINKIYSLHGAEINGFYIVLPILPEQIQELKPEFLADTITATKVIAERLGAIILGLDIHLSLLFDKFSIITQNSQLSVIDGNSLTAWSLFEAVYRSAKIKGLELKKSSLLIINACSPIGWLCAEKSAEYMQKLILSDANSEKLDLLKNKLAVMHPCEVVTDYDLRHALDNANIVIIPDNSSGVDRVSKELEPKIIANKLVISLDGYTDETIIKGGLIKLANPINLKLARTLPDDIVEAALAQTMLSAFTGIFWNYSLAENSNLHELEEVADIAVVYDLEVWLPNAPII